VVDAAGPRLQIWPVAGLPLLHVDKLQYRGASKTGKLLVDLVGAGVRLVLVSPLLLLVVLAIKLTSPGPVYYRAERIEINGAPFSMRKSVPWWLTRTRDAPNWSRMTRVPGHCSRCATTRE